MPGVQVDEGESDLQCELPAAWSELLGFPH